MRKQTRCSKNLSWWRDRRLSVLDGHNNAPYPQSGNHTQDKTRLEKIEQGALPLRERDLEHGVRHFVKTHCRTHANPQSGHQLTKSDPSRVPRNRAPREGPDGPAKCVELSTRQPVGCELKERRHDLAGLHLPGQQRKEFWEISSAVSVGIHFVDHILQLSLCWVLLQRPHTNRDGKTLCHRCCKSCFILIIASITRSRRNCVLP